MSILEHQQIIIYGASIEELLSVKEFIQRERIRFGEQNGNFELYDEPARLMLADNQGIYLQKGQPWEYPFNRVTLKFPNIRIEVGYVADAQMKKVFFGRPESQPEDGTLEKVREEKLREDAYFEEIQQDSVEEEQDSHETTSLPHASETIVPELKPINREFQTTESPATSLGIEVLAAPERKVDTIGNQNTKIQQQLVETEAKAAAAEILAKQAADRANTIEAQLAVEKSKRKETEKKLNKIQIERENIEQGKVEEQKETTGHKAKKAEVKAFVTEEDIVKERFMSSMLAIKSQLTEQSASNSMEDASRVIEEEQDLNSLSRIAYLIRQDKNADGMNAFHQAAKAGSFAEFSADQLNEHNLLLRDDEGNTALHWAAAKGILSEIPGHVLTPHNLLIKNNHRATCLHLASLGGCLRDLPSDILTMENVLDETDTGCTCLHLASIHGLLVDIPDQFFTYESLNMQNRNGQTPIEVAEVSGHGDRVPGVLRAVAADPNVSATGKLIKFKESMRKMRWQI